MPLGFTMSRCVRHGAGEELDPIRRTGRRVDRAVDRDRRTAIGDGAGQQRVVLQVIRAGVCVTRIVRRDTVLVQIDAQLADRRAAVGVDHVAKNAVSGSRPTGQRDAVPRIERDRVAFTRVGSADQGSRHTGVNPHGSRSAAGDA